MSIWVGFKLFLITFFVNVTLNGFFVGCKLFLIKFLLMLHSMVLFLFFFVKFFDKFTFGLHCLPLLSILIE